MPSNDSSACGRLSAHRCEVVAIAAHDETGAIGVDGGLPWHLPADLRHFKRESSGESVVMGRRTYESFDGPLPDRQHLVLTRQTDYQAQGVEVGHDLEAVADWVEERDLERLMVCGGAAVYEALLPACDAMILTVIHRDYGGDTHFPDYDESQWAVEREEFRPADEENEAAMTFRWLRRVESA